LSTGARIKEIREKRGLTQEQLAKKAEISKGFLSDVENGKRNIGSQGLLRIANELCASVDYLLAGRAMETVTDEKIVIPQALSQAAEDLKLSYWETLELLNTSNMVVARRGNEYQKKLTIEEWKKLYQAIKEVFELGDEIK